MALLFVRASSQYVTVPFNARMNITSFTISAWVNPGTVTMQRVMSRVASASTASEVYGLDVYQNNCRVMIGKVTTGGVLGQTNTYSVDTAVGGSVPAGVWSHVAGTYDGTTMRAYVNGVQVGTFARSATSIPLLTGTSALAVGADYNGSTAAEFFDGQMEEVRLYNRALTANELLTQYTTRGADSATFGLLLNLGMYEGSRATTVVTNGSVRDVGPFGTNASYAGTANMTFTDCLTRVRRSV